MDKQKIIILSAVLVLVFTGFVSNTEAQYYNNYYPNNNYQPNYNYQQPNYNYVPNYNYQYSQVYFSQNNISLQVWQNTNIILSGGSGSYYLSTSSSLVGTGINGNIMSLYGNSPGTANLVVCSSYGACGNLYVTVYANNNYYPYQQYNSYPQYYPQYQQYPNYQYQNPMMYRQYNQQIPYPYPHY